MRYGVRNMEAGNEMDSIIIGTVTEENSLEIIVENSSKVHKNYIKQ